MRSRLTPHSPAFARRARLLATVFSTTMGCARGPDPAADGGLDAAHADVGQDRGDVGDAGMPGARVRLAHLGPDAPAVDLCVRPRADPDFRGAPLLFGGGSKSGLRYRQVSGYLVLAPGAYNLRVVAAGAMDCDAPLTPALADLALLPTLGLQSVLTVTLTGLRAAGGPALALAAYADDAPADAGTELRVRLVHAAPTVGALDIGRYDTDHFVPWATGLAFGASPGADGGYTTLAPAAGIDVAARWTGSNPAARAEYPWFASGITLAAGGRASLFAIGTNTDALPLAGLLCNDATASGTFSSCATVPARAFVRLAHLVPDGGAIDACVAASGSSSFTGPILARAARAGGLGFAQISRYLPLGAPDSYTLRLVAAGSTHCASALVPDVALPALGGGSWATVAVMGRLANASIQVRTYLDSHDVPRAGRAAMRVVHAAPAPAPTLDLGTIQGGSFAPRWSSVAYTQAGSATDADANDFVALEPLPADGAIAARVHAADTTLVSLPSTLADGAVRSVFVIGRAGSPPGDSAIGLLVCDDRAASTDALAACSRTP